MYENERKLPCVLYENKMKGKERNVTDVIACVCRLENGERTRSRAVLQDDERVPRRPDSRLASLSLKLDKLPKAKCLEAFGSDNSLASMAEKR